MYPEYASPTPDNERVARVARLCKFDYAAIFPSRTAGCVGSELLTTVLDTNEVYFI